MSRINAGLFSFNRGIVSKRALARVDIEKLRLAAETQTNWLPTVLGPMMLRPGTQYIGATRSNAAMYPLRFVFANNDWAIIELTDSHMRVRLDNEQLVSFPTVSTTVTNGDFSSSTGWTLTAGGSSTVTISGNNLNLSGASATGTGTADRPVTVAAPDQGVRHCLQIVIKRGPVIFRAGTSAGDDSYIPATTLDTGTHFLGLTPTGSTFYIQFETTDLPLRIVDSVQTFGGTLDITTPWDINHLPLVRYEQSADVIFVACYNIAFKRIERRAFDSWSLVDYKINDGPFLTDTDPTITITPSGLTGDVTLTASRALFRSSHVGGLFRLFHQGQVVDTTLNALNDTTSAIRVTGVGTGRTFAYSLTFGSFSGTITLQRSFDSATAGFVDVQSFTSDTANGLNDTFDNSIIWYRFKVTSYTSGSGATTTLSFQGGGGAGICRITSFGSATSVDAEVLSAFTNVTATSDWLEGAWSDYRGYPTAVRLHEGRLFFASGDHLWGSVSDAYTSFSYDATGDSAPIDREVGYGAVDTTNWLLSLTRMIAGREGSEMVVRSSSLDDPLTVTNINFKDISTLGSARLPAIKLDKAGVFVQQSYKRIYLIAWDPQQADYAPHELTRMVPDLCAANVVAIGVQRQADTRLHFVLGDGTVAVIVYDTQDQVEAWYKVVTTGFVENVVVMPAQGFSEDNVYYVVRRTIAGSTVRYLERFARMDQCTGLPDARFADAHLVYSGDPLTSIGGYSHLEGQQVVAWGYAAGDTQGRDLGTHTIPGGSITGLPVAVVWACVGLGYEADFKSAKLAYAAQMGTALTQHKRAVQLGLILRNTHYQGIQFGQDDDTLDYLPLVTDGVVTPANTVWEDFDKPMVPVPGRWDTDARLILKASAPRPAEVMAAVVQVATNEG